MRIIRKYGSVILGILLVSISYNLFFSPYHLDTGGISGLAIVVQNLFLISDTSFMLVTNILLLILSYIVLGKELTKNSLLGSILFPFFVQFTSKISNIINIEGLEILIIAIVGGTISGIGYGLLFKNNFTSGGTDILNQIAEKKFKVPISKSMIYIDGSIVLLGGFIFGIEKMLYSIIALILISIISNKTMLDINKNKVFYIQSKKTKEIKKYLTKDLMYDVTIFESTGGFSNQKKDLILCSIKTSDYYKVSTGLKLIDKDAFITITENYESMNENKMVPNFKEK